MKSLKMVVAASALTLATPAFAADALINSVSEAANVVTIRGANFLQPRGRFDIYVSGFAAPLTASSYTNDTIVAFLPPGIAPGSYAASLVPQRGVSAYGDDFAFTLGSGGPKGDKGDKGDQGDPGTPGSGGAPDFDTGWHVVVSGSATPFPNYTMSIPYPGFHPSRVSLMACAWTTQFGGGEMGDVCTSRMVPVPTDGIHSSGVDINPAGINIDPAGGFVNIEVYAGWWAWGYYSAGTWGCGGLDCYRALYRVRLWR